MGEKKVKRGTTQIVRAWVQLGFFLLIAFVAVVNGLAELGVRVPFAEAVSFHAVCPFGGVVSFWNLITLGTLVKKAHESSVVLAVIGLILAFFFGPVICGWVCPFGTFQEWIGKLGRRITGKRYDYLIPRPVDRVLRFFRYVVLIWVSWMTVVSGKLIFQDIDPYYALFNFWSREVTVAALVMLGLVAVLAFFIERPFCKYFCPYGAFQGIFNLFRVFSIRRNSPTCISCRSCDRACPMNIQVSESKTVRNHQCISCLKCISSESCPVDDTVVFSGFRGKIKMSGPLLGLKIVSVFIVGIAVSIAIGKWNVSSEKQPAPIKTGEFKGLPNPGDIRGSYTWNDVAEAFGIPSAQLVQAFNAGSADEKVNTLETIYAGKVPEGLEIGTDSVRLFVSLMTALPYTPESDTVLPPSAGPVLVQYGKADPGLIQKAVDDSNSLGLADLPAAAAPAGDSQAAPAVPVITITGKTTFRDLQNAGYNLEKIQTVTGPVSDIDVTVKSVCENNGVEFSVLKEKLPQLK